MKRKGFTLIELLAVIVVLAIIALIATPTILGVIEKAKKGAAVSSAYGYVDAIEKEVALSSLKSQYYEDREYAYDEIGVSVKGEKPTGGIYTLKSGVITNGTFCIRGYEISYSGSKAEVQGKCSSKLSGNINLSETSGIVYVGKTKTLTISEATGELSCTSDNEDVATCLVEGTNIILNGLTEGTATITINVAESANYTSTSETYTTTVKTPILSDVVAVGDYVQMTPTSTSYPTDTSMTGYSSSQTINPSELNLWRVIKVKDDGTVDMVSEYVSSVNIYFYGRIGYQNFVGYLNTIAKQYENSQYTVGSRHMGYDGTQTEYITNTTTLTATSAPQTSTTSSSNVTSTTEAKGLGDMGYETDYNLVNAALGTLLANNPSGTATGYWLASRLYQYYSSSFWSYSGRTFSSDGINSYSSWVIYRSGFSIYSSSRAVRPIVTLKSGLQATGSGTSSDDPWILE